MERKRFCSFIMALVLLLTMLPAGVYAEDPPGMARVSSQGEFELALADGNVDHIIAESVELDIQQGTELTKDLTITSSAGLRISDNGLFIVLSDVALTVDGYVVVRQNGELRVGGTLINNGMVNIGGVLSAAAPAVIQNNGSLAISSDPAIGEGLISFFDIISDGDPNPADVEVLTVTLGGSVPEVTGGAINWVADVNGRNSLDYAMANELYDGIWLSQFHDEGDPTAGPTTGVAITYDGNLTITKPLDILENDALFVNGDLTVAGPEGKLYIGGDFSISGDLINNNGMFIEGSLTVGGTATNYGSYTQTASATVIGTITDVGDGDHMRGYYVTNQAEWETALSDNAHCNPIVIGTEAVSAGAIVITTDTAVTSNLMVEGDLIINEGATFSLQMRYDGDVNGVLNDVSGTLINNGTLETIVPLPVCGTFVNNGTLITAANNGDDQGENWTEDGSIVLYVFGEEGQLGFTGHLENNGTILNGATISVNGSATAFNDATGLIEGGTINSWWGISSENTFPLSNKGLIRFANIELNYTHLAYRNLDNTGSGWYENPEYGYGYELYCQKGSQYCGLFGLWDYDDVSEAWGFAAATPGALVLSSGSGIALETLHPGELSADPAQDVGNSAAFVRMTTSEWGDHEISYTAADSTVYRMAATVDIPPMGYYTAPTASREAYLSSATYTPGAGEIFYAIVNGDFSDGWTSNFAILNGADQVTVATTAAVNVYEVTVNEGTRGDFGLNLKIILSNPGTSDWMDPTWWIDLYETETEGLVFSWTQWRDEDSLGIQYPVIQRDGGQVRYNTSLDTGPGGQMLSFFYRHWVGDENTGNWVYTPVAADQLTATSGSGIVLSAWQHEQADFITDEDYEGFSFTELEFPNFGDFVISYSDYLLPVSVTLPEVAFYSAPEATQENYIGEFSYGAGELARRFYLIAAPNANIESDWNTDVYVHEGGEFVAITATDIEEVFVVTVKPDVTGDFRLRAEIRYWDGGEYPMWQSDREIIVSEEPVEGLVFNWAEWRSASGIDYPAVSKDGDGNIAAETQMGVAIGGLTAPFFYRHLSGEEWVLTPVEPAAIIFSSGSGISIREWTRDGIEAIGDPDYTDHRFAEIIFTQFGQFELAYDTGDGLMALPVTVRLPDAGFYDAPTASEENYISEFHYTPDGRSFYFIANPDIEIGEGWTSEYEILDGAGNVDVTTTGALGVFLVTVSASVEDGARFHGKIRYFDEIDAERWQADRDILLYEVEMPGLVLSWTDWKDAAGTHYPALTGDPIYYERSLEMTKGGSTFAFFYKHWVGEEAFGQWVYTPVSPEDLILPAEGGITAELWFDENMEVIPADDGQYHDYIFTAIDFPELGVFTIGYQDGETLYQMTANIILPGLGAYSASGGGEENWLREVPIDQYRTVYLVPTVDLSEVDLSCSVFIANEYGEDPQGFGYDAGTEVFSLDRFATVTPHKTEGVIDYFTVDITALPFDPDFDLGLRLRNSENEEIFGTAVRFQSNLPDAETEQNAAPLVAPVATGGENDTSVALPAVPAGAVRYAIFVSGTLEGDGYLLKLTGDSPGARLYIFDENWNFMDQSAFENLTEEGHSASLWVTGLTPGDTYYVAAHNESDVQSSLQISASQRATPPAPTVTDPFYGSMFTMGVNVSGAVDGQHYILYTKIDGHWQWRGDEPFDASNDPRFIHLFDFLQPGESAQSIGVAIGSDGIEGPITEREVTVIRQDTQAATPVSIELMAQISSGSDNAAIRLMGGDVFADEAYYRLHHEDTLGEWDYNASFFGDGTAVAQGGAQMDPEGISEGGRWVLTKYRSVGIGATYTEGWETLIDTGESFGSLQRLDFDLFHATLDSGNNRIDLSIEARSQKPAEGRAVSLLYALYDSNGRLIDLVLRPGTFTAAGLDDGVSIAFDSGNRPAQCKIFVLNEGCGPETEALARTLAFDE
ncbi:MAG TPA: hypothetical protein DF480_03180 [Clostridiales bacterium]|nr:hypothetical protein [Clostridiales bacterium]